MATNEILKPRPPPPTCHNLTAGEIAALKSISQNQNIIIKRADKGGAVVLMNKLDYIQEGLRQLNDTKFYKKIPKDTTNKLATDIQNFLQFLKTRKVLPVEHISFLTPKNPRTPIFYLLPKIHKRNNPGRPIVSACDGPTEKLSAYLDFFLQPLAQKVNSYIKDTNHFLQKLENLGTIPQNAYLITIDVVALYTNIPHREGILAVKEALETRSEKQPLTWVLLRILHLILTKTAFKFNDSFYEQIAGTTMGTKCAPSYAILFMGKFEEDFMRTRHTLPMVWWRFIDDIFMIWPHSPGELYSFLEALNNVHESIKFTTNISQTQVNFLDVSIYKDTHGNIRTGLYTKPTDAHLYLHYTSYHPKHQKNSIPFSQAIRLRRICSTSELLQEATQQLSTNLQQRGYPKEMINQAILKASQLDRNTLLKNTSPQRDKQNIIPFITTYNPFNPPIHKILYTNRHILSSSPELKFLSDHKLIIVNKRSMNLQHILTRTDINKPQLKTGSNPCQSPCTTCKYMTPTDHNTVWTTKQSIPIQGRLNCKTKSVVYVLSCKKCGLQYVGQTGNTFNERFRAHLTDIRQGNAFKPVSRHFTSYNHSTDDVIATIVTQTSNNVNIRLRTEEVYISIFNSRHPAGLNLIQ